IVIDERLSLTGQGLLIRSLTQADSGVYHCHAPLRRINLQVIPSQRVGELLLRASANDKDPSPKHKLWYRDFMSLLEHPDLNSVDEFCERVWKREKKPKGKKTPKVNPIPGVGAKTDKMPQTTAQSLQNPQRAQNTPKVPNNPTVQILPKSTGLQRSQVPGSTVSTESQSIKPDTQSTQKVQNAPESQRAQPNQGKRGTHTPQRGPPNTAKWKQLQENKRGRNRRTHEQQRPPRSVAAIIDSTKLKNGELNLNPAHHIDFVVVVTRDARLPKTFATRWDSANGKRRRNSFVKEKRGGVI
ncbi:hypothetical protein M9458_009752, partial [Cirrhinus mrigala]